MRISRKQAKQLGIDVPGKNTPGTFGTAEVSYGPVFDAESVLGPSLRLETASVHVMDIPNWTPPTANQWYGHHWRSRHKIKKAEAQLLAALSHCQEIPKATGKRRVSLEVWGWPQGCIPDADAFDKTLLDGLRDCGLILDDNAAGLDGRMSVKINRSRVKRTVITLEDC